MQNAVSQISINYQHKITNNLQTKKYIPVESISWNKIIIPWQNLNKNKNQLLESLHLKVYAMGILLLILLIKINMLRLLLG